MTSRTVAADEKELCSRVEALLEAGDLIRLDVPGGRLHIDRPLPFLCVYRHSQEVGPAAAGLVHAQPSYLIADSEDEHRSLIEGLIETVLRSIADRFGSALMVEIWTEPPEAGAGSDPVYRIAAADDGRPATIDVLANALAEIAAHPQPAEVIVETGQPVAPPGLPPLMDATQARKLGCLHLGLAVPGFFFEPRSGTLYPLVFRALQRELGHAIQHAAFEFAQMQTTFPVEDYRSLGRRALVDATGAADARLAKLAGELDFLLAITPVNTEEAWQRFSANGYSRNPALHYRPLTVDPDLYRRDLYAVKIEEAEDPAVAALLRAKRQELDEIVMLLEERGTRRFLLTSLKLFGGVDDDLAAMAESLLGRVDRDGRTDPAELIPVNELADLARTEIRRYAADAPMGDARVIVRDDVPGVMVVGADVIIGANSRIARARARALLQHEVGTHLVTAINGRAQPLKLLEVGLPGYMETQEGLAVFAEYVAGGLTTRRLATLAARVVAVRALIDGAEFVDTFRALHRDVGLTPRRAFSVAMRVHRAGGLTKDAIYLRGVDAVLRYLAVPNSVEPLIVGKLALPDVEIIEELQRRGVLKPPPLRPRWLDFPEGRARLESARRGLTVLDLAEGSTL